MESFAVPSSPYHCAQCGGRMFDVSEVDSGTNSSTKSDTGTSDHSWGFVVSYEVATFGEFHEIPMEETVPFCRKVLFTYVKNSECRFSLVQPPSVYREGAPL